MFFHPCRDVCQAAWDPCSYRWIIWSKREIELLVISIEMVGEAMCLYDGTQWCSVCGEEEGSKNRALGNPSDQLMCFGYLPSLGHLERPTGEIGFKPAKWNCVCVCVRRVGQGREPWKRSKAGGVNDIERHLHHSHRSRVPLRSSRRIKGGATTVEDERGPGFCFVCSSRLWGAVAFRLCLFILLLKSLNVF